VKRKIKSDVEFVIIYQLLSISKTADQITNGLTSRLTDLST